MCRQGRNADVGWTNTCTNTHVIEIDGGVGLQNAESILSAGADVLVAGSSVFKSENPTQTIERLRSINVGSLSF